MADLVAYGRFPPASSLIAAAPVLIGVSEGTFRHYGVEVRVVRPEPSTWRMLAAGGIDVGGCHAAFGAQPPTAGRTKAIAVYERHRPGQGLTALLARPDLIESGSLTEDPASIAGKRIGLLPGRPDDFLAWWGLLRQAGLTMKDVRIHQTPHDGQERIDALRSGAVDVVIGRAPRQRADEIESGLVRQWKLGEEVSPGHQVQYLSANTDFLATNQELVARFLAGWLDAVDVYRDAFDHGRDRTRIVDLLADRTGEDADLISTMTPAGFDADGRIDDAELQTDLEVLAEHALIPSGISASEVADLTVMSTARAIRSA